MTSKDSKNIPISMISSGFAEFCTVPLDTIKVNMQAQSKIHNDTFIKSASRIYTKNGLQGFYQSLIPSVTRQILSGGIRLGLYDQLKISLGWQSNILGAATQGAICGIVASTISMPFDLLKTKVQSSLGTKLSMNFSSTASQVWKKQGIPGFYRGYSQVLQRSVMISAVQMPVYFYIQDKTSDLGINTRSTISVFGSTLATTAVVYPVDLCKTQIQHKNLSGINTASMIIKVAKESGIRGLYKGSAVGISRALPQFWLTSLFYENFKNLSN